MENIPLQNAPLTPSQQLLVEPVKPSSNKVLILFIFLEIITLFVASYFGYQYYLLKKQAIISQVTPPSELNSTSTNIPSSQPPSSFKYTYFTPEEYRQKITALLINANKNKKDSQISSESQFIDRVMKDYQELDEFTKWVLSSCPSTFFNNSQYSSLDDTFKLPFSIQKPYIVQCMGSSLWPARTNFVVDISSTNFGTPIQSSLFLIMGYKASGGGMYGIFAREVLERIDSMATINGARVEAKNKSVRDDTGELMGYNTFLYAYKQFPNFLVASYVILDEKTDENFRNLSLNQYPNINSKYKGVVDQLTELVASVEPK